MTRVHIIGTGGTIVSRTGGTGSGSVAVDTVAGLARLAAPGVDVSSEDLMTVGSYRLDLAALRAIAEAVARAAADDEVAGIVVTHGTDTMEESAFLTELVHDSAKPVVFTGAQLPADRPDSDGPQNLRQAVLAASDPQLQGCGVLVCFAGVVQSARGVRKSHTIAPSPFDGGLPVAHFVGDRLQLTGRPARRPALPLPGQRFDLTRVDVLPVYPGSSIDLAEAAFDHGAECVVLAGTGTGNAGEGYTGLVERAVAVGRHVVLASRVHAGPVVPIYGNGGGVDLSAAGALPSGDLNPFQARLLAALLISRGLTGDTFADAFAAHS